VAKPGASLADVTNALNYACGEGGADCIPIQVGNPCYEPDTLTSHASYAFNSYYQLNGRNYWNCYFGNTGLITITDPSKNLFLQTGIFFTPPIVNHQANVISKSSWV
jgi:hypothetical protein